MKTMESNWKTWKLMKVPRGLTGKSWRAIGK
jgi:hypothetical protein